MFSLHETTKIRLCRAGFLALCVGPMCAVLAWSLAIHLPWYRSAHERAIAAALGWQTRLTEVSTPQPGLVLYRGLELIDPNNGQPLARLPFVEIESTGEELVVRLPFPAIVNGTRLDAFWAVVRDMAQTSTETHSVRFEAQNLTLHLADGDQTFTNLVGQITGDASQALAKLSFNRAIGGESMSEPCEVTLTRRMHASVPMHSVDFSTSNAALPCGLIAAIWPGVERFGKQCHFTGTISAIEQAGSWHTQLSGALTGIDLEQVLGKLPHKLTGRATARLERATIIDGRLEQAAGSVSAGPGVISRSLVLSAEKHLHVRAADAAYAGRTNLLDYRQLCVGFELGSNGITLRGEVPKTRGVMLADARGPLADEPPVISQPVVDLIRTLVPQSDVQVPATRETAVLTAMFPVPPVVPEVGHEEPLIQARAIDVIAPRPLDSPRKNDYPLKRF
jgi:hypothetical protein